MKLAIAKLVNNDESVQTFNGFNYEIFPIAKFLEYVRKWDLVYIAEWAKFIDIASNIMIKSERFTKIKDCKPSQIAYIFKVYNKKCMQLNIKKNLGWVEIRPIFELVQDEQDLKNSWHVLMEIEDIDGLKEMTATGSAFASFKNQFTFEQWNKLHPKLSDAQTDFIKSAYLSGFTYMNPKANRYKSGIVYDDNSAYLQIMANYPMPYGVPEVGNSIEYDRLQIMELVISGKVKRNHPPMLAINWGNNTKYSSNIPKIKPQTIILTTPELNLLCEHYNIKLHTINRTLTFKSQRGLYKDWLDKRYQIKRDNPVLQKWAKKCLVSIHGRLYLEYPAVAAFVISYHRADMARLIAEQMKNKNFVYTDTDSLHLRRKVECLELGQGMGEWKEQYLYSDSEYIRERKYKLLDKYGEVIKNCNFPDIKNM